MLPYDPAFGQLDQPASAQAGPGPSTIAQKRSSVVTTTITNDDGTESARVGACSNCRTRKIRCSGDRPVCKTCAKNDQECDYPIHISRKRKGKDGHSASKRPSKRTESADPIGHQSTSNNLDTPQPTQSYSTPAFLHDPNLLVSNQFPTLDFTANSLPLNNYNGFDGTQVDNAWLESFLAYDFGDEVPLPLPLHGHQTWSGVDGGQRAADGAGPAFMAEGGQLRAEAAPAASNQAKFRVPYFR
jgi:hypothetical protein